MYGPFEIDKGHATIMQSSSSVPPDGGQAHPRVRAVRDVPHALSPRRSTRSGKVIGELPEQVPYQEWLHSDFREKQSCQSCHMPVVKEDVPITSVFGEPREGSRGTCSSAATSSCSGC